MHKNGACWQHNCATRVAYRSSPWLSHTALNIKVLSYKTNTIENIKNTILELGILFKKEEKSKEMISRIDDSLNSLKSIVENKKILIVISPKDSLSNQIYVTGNFLYFEDIIKASGNKNAYNSENQAQPVVNTEWIIFIKYSLIFQESLQYLSLPKK